MFALSAICLQGEHILSSKQNADILEMIYKTKRMPKLIVVDADGDIVTAANGQVSSDNRSLVRIIKKEALFRTKVQLVAPFGQKVRATLNPDDLMGITAALFSARPGRTRLLEAPAEVWEWFKAEKISASCSGHTSSINSPDKDLPLRETTDEEIDTLLDYFGSSKDQNTGDN
jgi:hypothetical protein